MKFSLALVLSLFLTGPATHKQSGGLAKAMAKAEAAMGSGDLEGARTALARALERDPNSLLAWAMIERWAEKSGDRDEQVYALHRQVALTRTQTDDKAALKALQSRLSTLDPVAVELGKLRLKFVDKLTQLGEVYVKGKRPHSAIRAYKQALALDPDRVDIGEIIARIAEAPDPSLAEDALPKDLLEGISEEWILEHDEEHLEWRDKARLDKENYRTKTNAGYAVLVRASEAMEQMNAFYRIFFNYGDKATPRIDLNIFRTRDEYLKFGEGPPVEWSGGHFTGSAVETYITNGGFEDTVGTLFHEAAHQFVSLATNASGWLNEGMASFFEGSRILSNGTVLMNMPANGRLFPLANRMKRGWMSGPTDGTDSGDPNQTPQTAPSFRIVVENKYEWGPPWYAPTWGVVYFLYNFQDPADGRFVYRKAFGDFVNASGGKVGKGAVRNFEEVVLANPEPATKGITSALALPLTIDELNEVWKDYILDLRARQSGAAKEAPPYHKWAKNALTRKAEDDAAEFFESALLADPTDLDVLSGFAEFLIGRKNRDRAAKLLGQALAVAENTDPVDKQLVGQLEARLRKIDPSYKRLADVRSDLIGDIGTLIERYLTDGMNLQAMDVAFHLGGELQEPSLFAYYERAVRAEGRSIAKWRLAYNEENLRGWNSTGLETIFKPQGEILRSKFGVYSSSTNDYSILTLDQITSGDFSLEAEVEAQNGNVNFVGLVFGRKSATDCHALILFPPAPGKNGFVNLVTFYGGSSADTWRRNPVQHAGENVTDPSRTRSSGSAEFYKLRIDVTGRLVDVWVNGEYQATQEFPSLNILRGSFGLITGRGEARFKNVRFLSRNARDPSAAIERKLVLEEQSAGGEAINGSWLGQKPPFPTVQRWLSGERESWDDARGYPQLFVLWSTEQNDQVEIDRYLSDLFERHQDIGLRMLNLLAFWNEAGAEQYLAEHSFPDAVGLDTPTQAERNFGVTFERYDVMRFHLPRFILLDIDGTVAWEGDPGFASGEAYTGQESLLDVPLRELVAKRRLTDFVTWRRKWPGARLALAAGNFKEAVPVLEGAADFDATVSEEVAEASAYLAAVEDAAGGFEDLALRLAEDGREPALQVLMDWGAAIGRKPKRTRGVSKILKGPNMAAWKRVPGLLKPALKKAGKNEAAVNAAMDRIAALPGAFPAELAERGRAVADDPEAMQALYDEVRAFPATWLASEHFGW